jgi:hypothetical protein
VCVAATVCNADWLEIRYTGFGPGDGNTWIYYNGGAGANVSCGLMNYEIGGVGVTQGGVNDSGDTSSIFEWLEGRDIETFCADIYQNVDDSWHTLEIKPLTEIPINGGSMSDESAEMISALWYAAFNDFDSSSSIDGWAIDGWNSTNAAGMQAAIWEIAFEGAADLNKDNSFAETNLDIDSGSNTVGDHGFYMTGLSANDEANDYMEAAWNLLTGDYDWCHNLLWGVDESDWQGVIIPIPLPAPFALAGIGLLGVLAGRRKLTKLVR